MAPSPANPSHKGAASSRQSRVVGALLALHAGDSLGASLEFKTHSQIKSRHPQGLREIIGGGSFNWPAGHATDDTDMTRGVLLAYRDARTLRQQNPGTRVDVAKLAGDHFIDWFDGKWPDRKLGSLPLDMGGATIRGLDKYRQSRDPGNAGAGSGSAGNGSLMRCLPTGLFQRDLERVTEESVRISMITHDDFRCTAACAVYNHIVAALIEGASVEYALRAGEGVAIRLEKGRRGQVYLAVQRGRELMLQDMAEKGPPADLKGGCSGYVLESLTVAVAAVRDFRSLEDCLVDVVRIGRDTDTNAAIAGGLLGARDGEEAIPERWKEKLQFGKEFRDVAAQLMSR
ncbi:hypothetical protein ACJZ2D_003384 [Fusarium nematophilum]